MNEGSLFGEREGWHLLYRALLFVNGWMFGKASLVTLITDDQHTYGAKLTRSFAQRVAKFGPQTRFPVPPGILDYNGKK